MQAFFIDLKPFHKDQTSKNIDNVVYPFKSHLTFDILGKSEKEQATFSVRGF
jgi:hypothetical protein